MRKRTLRRMGSWHTKRQQRRPKTTGLMTSPRNSILNFSWEEGKSAWEATFEGKIKRIILSLTSSRNSEKSTLPAILCRKDYYRNREVYSPFWRRKGPACDKLKGGFRGSGHAQATTLIIQNYCL